MEMISQLVGAVTHRNFRRLGECATVISWLGPRPGERILDVGCGDGYYSAKISRKGAHVVGVDINEKRLAWARNFFRTARTEFHFQNAEDMRFADSSFDKAVSFCTVEHFHSDERVIANIARVLKTGGWFVFSADSLSNPGISDRERRRHQQRFAVNNFYTLETVRPKLEKHGLHPVEARYILTSPLSLALARFSWKLDNWPAPFAVFRGIGHLILGTAGRLISAISERLAARPARPAAGLTLLVRARKLGAS